MKSATKVPNGHGSLYKEVRFSPTVTPIRRAQSVSTSNPSNSQFPGRGVSVGESYSALSSAYLQQSRSLLERQRENFENERAIFAEERLLWERERAMLKLRISELESLLETRGQWDRSSGASTSNPHRSQFAAPWSTEQNNCKSHAFDGLSPGSKATRVFQNTEKTENHLAPISEQGGNIPSLDAALSPRSRAVDTPASSSVSVPIEKLDSDLDGITLKSTALPPEVVARVMTPPSPLPTAETSPSIPHRPSMERRNSLKLKLSDLGPPDKNRTMDAGHTPMAIIDADPEAQLSPGEDAAEMSSEPNHRPTETAESYFPDVADAPDDPALKGPLSLLNDEDHDRGFLSELDQKLLGQARQLAGHTSRPEEAETDAEPPSQGEPEPELKFKNTTNFGSAFGKAS